MNLYAHIILFSLDALLPHAYRSDKILVSISVCLRMSLVYSMPLQTMESIYLLSFSSVKSIISCVTKQRLRYSRNQEVYGASAYSPVCRLNIGKSLLPIPVHLCFVFICSVMFPGKMNRMRIRIVLAATIQFSIEMVFVSFRLPQQSVTC